MLRIEIRVKGRLDVHWSDWFDGFAIEHTDQDETILTGTVVDQPALYGLLSKLRNLGLPLVSVDVAQSTDAGDEITDSGFEASAGQGSAAGQPGAKPPG
jgi:hypothetical protein